MMVRSAGAVQAERFKMLAGGTQLIAVGVLGASIVAPTFNSTLHLDTWLAVGGGTCAALIELAAWVLMGYGVPPVEQVPEAAEREAGDA